MREKQIKWTGTLLVAVLAAGISQGAVIAFDGFDTAASADPVNGIYQSGLDLKDSAHNSTVGGNIVGFSAANVWSTYGSTQRAYDNHLLFRRSTSTSTLYATRDITSGLMSGKTVAYGSVDMNISRATATAGESFLGWTTDGNSSDAGATVGVKWDGAEYDLVVRYNNGSATVATVMDGISTATEYNVIWGMNDDSNTLKVWVDATSTSDTPTLSLTDYAGIVSKIDAAYGYQYRMGGGSSSDGETGMSYDNLTLGDSMADVIPEPGTLSMLGLATFGALLIRRIRM